MKIYDILSWIILLHQIEPWDKWVPIVKEKFNICIASLIHISEDVRYFLLQAPFTCCLSLSLTLSSLQIWEEFELVSSLGWLISLTVSPSLYVEVVVREGWIAIMRGKRKLAGELWYVWSNLILRKTAIQSVGCWAKRMIRVLEDCN